MTKPAILHICLSQGWGGLEMYPIRIGKEFIKQGYEVYGLCVANTQVAYGMREAGLETFEVKSKNTLVFSQIIKLNNWLKERSVKIIHNHKSGDILVSALLNQLTPRKAFFTEHMGVTRPKKSIYHQWAYKHITQVFSISNETYQRNIKALPVPENKITRLWLGTDIPNSPIEESIEIRAIRTELNITNNQIVIGNIGRFCSGKGQLELIEAFALLKDKYSNTKLLLVGGLISSEGGDDNYTKEVNKRISQLGIENKVILAGFRKDTPSMLAAMDIVCLPNHNEAFGLTAIEAMAARKAIVGANTGALPEILEPVALLANPLDPREIAIQLSAFLDNQHLIEKKAQAAYERARTEFSMTTHIERLKTYYSELNMNSTTFTFKLRNKLRVKGNHQISIANTAKVRGCDISIKGKNNNLIIEEGVNLRGSQLEIDGNNCVIKVGKNSIIGHGCYLSARELNTQLILGEKCMLSRNVKIMTSDGHDILKDTQRVNPAKNIYIGNHVWLADNATVLKGVTIGKGSVVGINSTLTKSLEENCIAAGNPAKKVQDNIEWNEKLTF